MSGRRLEVSTLAVALGLHVAVLVGLRLSLGEGVSNVPTAVSSRPAPFEIELADEAETPGEGAGDVSGARPGAVARVVPRDNASRTELESVEAETGDFVEGPTVGEHETNVEQEVPPKPIDLGLGPDGWQRWVRPPKKGEAPRADRASPRENRFQFFRARPASTTGGLQEGLEESDRELGLGPHGRVLSALHRAAQIGFAPDVGVARFEVTVHRGGTVDVGLLAASSHREQWKKVAAHVASDLRSAPPRIPPRRDGLRLVVELVAERTLPNGTKASELEKPHLDVPPPKLQSTEEGIEQTKRENPTTKNPTPDDIANKLDMPGVYVAERGTVCSYRVGVGAISPGYRLGAGYGPSAMGTCDPSHLGATPQRMVRTRVVEQSFF